MQIFVNSVERLNSPVYCAPPCITISLVCNECNFTNHGNRLIFTYLPPPNSWWRGTVVERRSLTGELSLSCARPAADG